MKSSEELRRQLHQIDHKGYKAYKILEGEYEFGAYRLCIDHVQGDPFATPSRVRIVYKNQKNIPEELFKEKYRRIAIEDALLRRLHRNLYSVVKGQRRGSGKSGLVTACRAGQEILERSAMHITSAAVEARIEVGFPAFGRTIAAGELEALLFDVLPEVTERTFRAKQQLLEELKKAAYLADDQYFIRQELPRLGLAAFVADGSILPRESGISQKKMEGAVPFESPESLAVTLQLPRGGTLRGMGIRRGITVIAGGGFHGKSTLLKALERGVYDHIAGDGREYVITDETAFKLRAEEGRSIHGENISMFIDHLPTKADTTDFTTENASGSTSQAANTVEALAAGSIVLLIDEDTSATNFMVRDGRMAQLVSDEKEPITPFIRKIRSLYQDLGVSTILVAGSSGDYLSVADTVLQMDCYRAYDVTEKARALAQELKEEKADAARWLRKPVRKKEIEKIRVHGWDSLSIDKSEIDLRYLEQVVDESQTAALGYIIQYILTKTADGRKTPDALAEELAKKLDTEGILSITPKNYSAGPSAMVRKQEILACLCRYRLV
ncbi:MAG: ABC-ATPase domain-containing protein [Lachnospiraceae bacterium]|nr:ABC-ATPase domain-containing protein [Lachnospiraceae bacterium]